MVESQVGVRGYNGDGAPELSPGALPGDWGLYTIPTHSGVNVIRFAGSGSRDAHCSMKAYATHILIDSSTKLSYWIFPQQASARFAGVDLHCTDGTTLSGTAAVDQNGASMDPSKGHGEGLAARTWSQIECDAGKWLDGKTVDAISMVYHNPDGGGQYRGYVDDIVISDDAIQSRSQIVGSASPAKPAWVKNAVIYGVNTRQFSTAGTLAGIVPQLDRLHSMGVTVLWLLPINPVGVEKAFGSPYCVRDYYAINPAYGKPADLHRLVDAAHSRGIKVILDLPLNHTSWDNPLTAQHPDWYRHADGDARNPISRTPSWPDVAQLDYSNLSLRAYMMEMQKYWLKTYGIDGFRYDSAELLPTEFWNDSTAALKAVKPDILLLGESHRPDTMMKAFDVDYSFTLYPELMSVMQGHDMASAIGPVLQYEHFQFPSGTLHMRYSGNQDTGKPAALFGRQGSLAAALFMFTLDGVPMIYNGQEVGDAAGGNFISAPPIDWAAGDKSIGPFYAQLAALRRTRPELVDGPIVWVGNSDPHRIAAYARSNGSETVVVVVNLTSTPVKTALSLKKDLTIADVTPAAGATAPAKPVTTPVSNVLGPYGFRVYACKGGVDQVVDSTPSRR